MKHVLQFSIIALTSLVFSTGIKAQDVYWREGFSTWDGPTADPGTAATIGTANGEAGLWGYYGIWRTTGTGCPYADGTANPHIRSTSAAITGSGATTDTAYLITPLVSNGISSVSIIRSRQNRRTSFYWTPDASITTTNWILATATVKSASSPVAICVDTVIMINQPTARRLQIRFEKAGNSDVDSIVLFSATSLPVTLSNIRAYQKVNGIQIEWSNATESNMDRYAVERSANGRVFTEIGSVNTLHNQSSAAGYAWNDASPLNGNNFYRIKAYEKDGGSSYTSIVKVSSAKSGMSVTISPNPVKGTVVNLQLANFTKATYSITLFNSVGQRVYTKNIYIDGGSSTLLLQLPSVVRSGAYQLQLTNGETLIDRKLVVQ